jgi:outer membrane protein OmpA-like peptidoglycan-associated protein
MAQLDVKPKRNTSWWIWVLLTIFALAALFYFVRSCGRDDSDPDLTGGDSTVIKNPMSSETDTGSAMRFASAGVTFNEISDKDIEVRGSDGYVSYSLDETVLFDPGQKTIRTEAEPKLMQIAESLKERFNDGEIKLYGFTDSTGSAAYNKELAAQRAEAVRYWIIGNANVKPERISISPIGEKRPVASNNTAQGQQQNRRVEIVARNQAG